MFPKEIIETIEKYQVNDNYSSQINSNMQSIISVLRDVDTKIKQELINAMSSSVSEEEQSLLNDSQVIRNYIESIQLLPQSQNTNTEIAEEIISETYSISDIPKPVKMFLCEDKVCPVCGCTMEEKYTSYTGDIHSNPTRETISSYRCGCCGRFFICDYTLEDINIANTNLSIIKDFYFKIPQIDIYSVIVLSNTLKCSSNHDIKDITAKLPVLNEYGQISYISINASYCQTCNRYTILKEDFNAIAGIVTCKVIDETVLYSNINDSDIEIDTKHSILAQYGYNVQTKKDLSEQQRHIILSSLIEAQIMSRREVIDHISTLIDRGSKIPNWKFATQKWKDDRKFVSEYQSDCLPEVVFNNIILKYRKSRS